MIAAENAGLSRQIRMPAPMRHDALIGTAATLTTMDTRWTRGALGKPVPRSPPLRPLEAIG